MLWRPQGRFHTSPLSPLNRSLATKRFSCYFEKTIRRKMAGEFLWMRETPELDSATTESSGERIEELQTPSTPETQVAGLASFTDNRVEFFLGEQYPGYEPGAGKGIFQSDLDKQALCALHAPIGFESQRAANETLCQQHSAQRLEPGEVQATGATAEGYTVQLENHQYVHSVESVPVNERLANPDYIPTCFTDIHADLVCFHCGHDPTQIDIDLDMPLSSAPTTPPQHLCSPSPSQQRSPPSLPTARPKVRIPPAPASTPRQISRAATCEWCNKTFSRPGGLPRHQSASCPNRPIGVRRSLFVCLVCQETKPRKDKIQLHCQKKHGQLIGKETFVEKI
ncbi:hypothetical protein CB0940_04763 [Cercospora beticola]|uniref:C2H2-type domain-containing protein n=2 Tax=Cercospora beticola TaxID=122368 RepID=A0A2G5HLY7_CERBT|nr:hypothetical protein CB0940_04763 [Cercospora beticola]PIA93518.1 hypothetical protein CB0940_04763 [Cercospora beticola]